VWYGSCFGSFRCRPVVERQILQKWQDVSRRLIFFLLGFQIWIDGMPTDTSFCHRQFWCFHWFSGGRLFLSYFERV
jgi:hypothetical protein